MRRAVVLALAVVLAALAAANMLIPSKPLAADAQADHLVINKRAHTLTLYRGSEVLKTYHVALGRGGLAPKQRAGDNRVPEGNYTIAAKNAHSAYHRALRVSYPTLAQASAAQRSGYDAGGDIMIHGIRNGLGWLGPAHRFVDWTKGCIAVTDIEVEELMHAVPQGTRLTIEP